MRIERVVTSGTFSLDGGTWEVDNNVWVVGDDALMGQGSPLPGTRVAALIDLIEPDDAAPGPDAH